MRHEAAGKCFFAASKYHFSVACTSKKKTKHANMNQPRSSVVCGEVAPPAFGIT